MGARVAALALALLLAAQAAALDNGLMLRPAMGYNTWNAFHDNISEALVMDAVERMVSLGLVAAGYDTFALDDGWSERRRDADGSLAASRARFPSGIAALAEHVHSRGMKLGIYSDAGTATCLRYPASLGFETRDADAFAAWGVDFLKYDNCYSVPPNQMSVRERYEAMRAALNRTGRPIAFSMCEWGVSSPWEYAGEVGNSWRTSADVSLSIEADWRGVVDNLDSVVGLSRFAGPGGWNDCDMLEVGLPGSRRLTLPEQQAHFALWALVKSPLFIGADLTQLGREELAILTAREVIALHQDALGVAGDLVWQQGPKQVWAAPLAGGDRAVVLFNRHMNSDAFFQWADLTVAWPMLGLPADCTCKVRDLFARETLGSFRGSFKAAVRNHGVLALRISPLGVDLEAAERWRPWHDGISTSHPGEGHLGDRRGSASLAQRPTGGSYLTGVLVGMLVGGGLALTLRSWSPFVLSASRWTQAHW